MNPHKPSDDLDAIRNGIDDVDQKILQLLAERRSFSVRAARLKGEKGSPSRDRLREEDLIAERIEVGMDHSIDSGLVNRLWREIVDDSVRVQRDLLGRSDGDGGAATVAIQGIDGSYSQLATRQIFAAKGDPEPSYVMCGAFAEAITAVQEGRADKAVLPIENTTSGAISEVYDLLLEGGLHIVGDLRFRVRHCLLGVAGADVDGIRRIYAHPQAAAQCSDFLSGLNECEVVLYEDTAGSGRKTAAMDDRAVAAIASEEAGRLSGLEVLSVSVANRSENYTRFVVVSPEPEAIPTGVPAKTSIVMTVGNHPGALMEALAVFDTADVNLVKLESRPIPTNPTVAAHPHQPHRRVVLPGLRRFGRRPGRGGDAGPVDGTGALPAGPRFLPVARPEAPPRHGRTEGGYEEEGGPTRGVYASGPWLQVGESGSQGPQHCGGGRRGPDR